MEQALISKFGQKITPKTTKNTNVFPLPKAIQKGANGSIKIVLTVKIVFVKDYLFQVTLLKISKNDSFVENIIQ